MAAQRTESANDMNEMTILEKVRPYLAKQQDEEGKALYNEISVLMGYGITSAMLQELVRASLQAETKLYEIKDAVEKQSALIILNKKTKELCVQIQHAMPTISTEDKRQAKEVLEAMTVRMASEVLGIDLRDERFLPTKNSQHKQQGHK